MSDEIKELGTTPSLPARITAVENRLDQVERQVSKWWSESKVASACVHCGVPTRWNCNGVPMHVDCSNRSGGPQREGCLGDGTKVSLCERCDGHGFLPDQTRCPRCKGAGYVQPPPREADAGHSGDCTYYSALSNGMPHDGICNCGYGLKRSRIGDPTQLWSKERQESFASNSTPRKHTVLYYQGVPTNVPVAGCDCPDCEAMRKQPPQQSPPTAPAATERQERVIDPPPGRLADKTGHLKPQPDRYFVEVDKNGCEICGAGRMWLIVDSVTGVAGGTSYADFEHAGDVCEAMNDAYAAGRESAQQWREASSPPDSSQNVIGLIDGGGSALWPRIVSYYADTWRERVGATVVPTAAVRYWLPLPPLPGAKEGVTPQT